MKDLKKSPDIKECEFCGRDVKEPCQTWCQEEDEWLDAPLTTEEVETLVKRLKEPLVPLDVLDEEIPNGNL